MSEQHIGRKRTFKVIDADGEESSTTVQTVGLQKKKARQLPPPPPEFDAQTPNPEPSDPSPITEHPAEVSENVAPAESPVPEPLES